MNALNLLRESTKEGVIRSESIFIGKFVERMVSMLNQNGISINQKYQIIDFTKPYDTRVEDKKVEKIEKYLDLRRELKKVWNMKVTVVQLVVGALGTPAKPLEKRFNTIAIEIKITELQNTALIHTARILRKVLEV